MSRTGADECSPSEPSIETAARMWGGTSWGRFVFPAFWLVYLGQPVQGVAKHSHGASAVVGYVIVGLFALTYLAGLTLSRAGGGPIFWALYVLMFGLTAAECFFAHQDALVFLVYAAVLTVATKRRWVLAMVLAMTAATLVVPRLVPSWHAPVQTDTALSVLLVSVAMWGFFNVIRSNMALTAARAEVARLAAENERSRIARDLHDLLGHSLTTITVKAGLARRLGERGETQRALAEIGEVEQLSRRTLGDVRAAVSAHREVTLAGELATAREVLRASGIIAELPGSVAEASPLLSELFGWVVREGVTNAVRHSRAEHVRITLGRDHIEIYDDGVGGVPNPGNGLSGLRERTAAAGGTLTVAGGLRGFRLRVEVPGVAEPPAKSKPAVAPAQAPVELL